MITFTVSIMEFVYFITFFISATLLGFEYTIFGFIPKLLYTCGMNTPPWLQKLYIAGNNDSFIEYVKYPTRDTQLWIIRSVLRCYNIGKLNTIDDDLQMFIVEHCMHYFADIKDQCLEAQEFIFKHVVLPNKKITYNKTLIHDPKSQELELALKLLS